MCGIAGAESVCGYPCLPVTTRRRLFGRDSRAHRTRTSSLPSTAAEAATDKASGFSPFSDSFPNRTDCRHIFIPSESEPPTFSRSVILASRCFKRGGDTDGGLLLQGIAAVNWKKTNRNQETDKDSLLDPDREREDAWFSRGIPAVGVGSSFRMSRSILTLIY